MDFPDYEVVIPTFQRPKLLAGFLRQIVMSHPTKLPRRVILVDDGSDEGTVEKTEDIRRRYSSDKMRVALLKMPTHQGYYAALRAGLERVEADYAVCCVDDLRLILEPQRGHAIWGALPNPLLTLTYYLQQAYLSILAAKEGSDGETKPPNPVGVVVPFIAKWETPGTIHYGNLSLFSMKQGMLPVVTNEKYGYHLEPLLPMDDLEFFEVPLAQHHCFALRMDVYRALGGISEELDPYPYGFWDYLWRMKGNGFGVYMTNRSVVYHRSIPYRKHPRSLTNIIANTEHVLTSAEALYDRWGGYSRAWLNGYVNPDTFNLVQGMSHDFSLT